MPWSVIDIPEPRPTSGSARCFSDLHSRPRKGRLTSVMHRVHLKTKMSSSTSRSPSSQSLHAGSLSASPSESSRVAEGSCLYSEGREGNEDRPSVSLEVADQREIMAIEFEKSHAAEVRQAARVAELEDLVSSARRKVRLLSLLCTPFHGLWSWPHRRSLPFADNFPVIARYTVVHSEGERRRVGGVAAYRKWA